ncbi:DEAD/DEAH box helicase [Pedobacter sp. 22226]|uniref:DEAD/DEAH box helicase n=1 Tax=Pedobacter sp. 22226 TaxID=3453894 RepID=UPI003F86CC02
MEFIVTSSEIKNNEGAKLLFDNFKKIAFSRKGCCYYKYPIAGGQTTNIPDIVIADLEYGLCILEFYSHVMLNDITDITEDQWMMKGQQVDSPILKLEDYVTSLKAKYDKYRMLRGKVVVNYYVVFPLIKRSEFSKKFNEYDIISNCKFSDEMEGSYESYWEDKSNFYDNDIIECFISVTQNAGRLNDFTKINKGVTASNIGESIKLIDTKIAYLDKTQHAAAIQIPDGPQRIRGMAGTGKTIILTMKAAFLHSMYPEAKILYTFNTQSLYNQIKNLITKFYRENEETDPNWDNLLIMHSWGGKSKQGVYYRACINNAVEPKAFSSSCNLNDVCLDALRFPMAEEYDFVLMDEAQDFSPSFYQLIYRLTKYPKRIIFAYDELQSLSKIAISDTGDLFGHKPDGTNIVDFSEGTYENGIEMDFVLNKSYRNPLEVLMTAHAIGLGLYNKDGYMQVIDKREIWAGIGYEVISGDFTHAGEKIIIERPKANSVSLAAELYSGEKKSIECKVFNQRKEEINWIAESISNDIKNEKVEHNQIMVISLDTKNMLSFFSPLSEALQQRGIASIIPGVNVEKDKFGEKGYVTLSTVYKAKGNEAFIVYVMAFDYLYNFVDFVSARNTAFTSISRSKGWCRISGIGAKMQRAINEINLILKDVPRFQFCFPDSDKISRMLSQEENARRLMERKRGSQALSDLLAVESDAMDDLTEDQKIAIRKKLNL